MVTKLLNFIHKHLNKKVLKSFFAYLDGFFRNLVETATKLGFFRIENHKFFFFLIFCKNKIECTLTIELAIVSSKLSSFNFFFKIWKSIGNFCSLSVSFSPGHQRKIEKQFSKIRVFCQTCTFRPSGFVNIQELCNLFAYIALYVY